MSNKLDEKFVDFRDTTVKAVKCEVEEQCDGCCYYIEDVSEFLCSGRGENYVCYGDDREDGEHVIFKEVTNDNN